MWRWFDNILSNKTSIMDYYLKPPAQNGLFEYDSLDSTDLSGAFYLLAVGLIISFIALLIEILVFQIKHRVLMQKVQRITVPSPTSLEPILIFPELLNELPQNKHFSSPNTIL